MPSRRKLDDYDEDDSPGSSQMEMKRKRRVIDDNSGDDDYDQSNTINDNNNNNNNDDPENDNVPTATLVFDQPVTPLPVGDDGYVEGSIVKIVLRNFVTYDFCEFTPGPQLNMIIGPNGTGKSTIVCAVALGLGGSPLLLGRARNISDFVKTGEDDASIQIELKKVDGRNVVIQRNIIKSGNKSTWKLNGRTVTYKEIMGIISSLNIQVDNLCQFLPQDKVAEFAQLTPPLLLSRTQVAVGDKNLIKWHQSLIDKRQTQKELQKTHESNSNYHKDLQTRNQLLEKDIHRIKEREKLAKEILLLKATLPLARYAKAKNSYEEAKANIDVYKAEKAKLEREARPVMQALRSCEAESKRDDDERTKAIAETSAMISQLHAITDSIKKSGQDQKIKKNAIGTIKKRELKREEIIKKLESDVNNLEEEIREEPPAPDDELVQEISDISREIDEIAIESRVEMENVQDLRSQQQELERQMKRKDLEIKEMANITKMRIENLRRYQSDTYKAFAWYRENKSLFKGQIYGPIQLQVNLKDKRFADQVENALGGVSSSHLRTFVCEDKDDYKKFMAELVDKQGLRLTASWPGDIDIAATMKTPCSDEELKSKYGLDHFVINLLEAPPIVLAYLCQQLYINTYPVTLQKLNVQRIVDHSNYLRFGVAGNSYRVKKYTYGRGGSQTTVRPTTPAKILTDSVNRELLARKHDEFKEMQINHSTIEGEMQSLNEKKQEYNRKLQELRHKREDKKQLRKDIQSARTRWEGKKMRLDRIQTELARKKDEPAQMEEEIERLKLQVLQETRRGGKLVVKYQKALESYVNKLVYRNQTSLRSLSSHGQLESMKTFAKSQNLLLDQAKKDYELACASANNCKSVARKRLDDANRAGHGLPEDLQDEFKEICENWKANGLEKSLDEIEETIHGLQAKSDALKMTNPLAVATYEKLMTEIKILDEKMANNAVELETINKDITELHNRWEPRLEQLVGRISEKFSEAFQRIGCAGEVNIGRDEDYAKWGINIQVKFRDNEKLQLLTGQRQSGGERAVSTILYLMSLQNLARAPFRVVDEINQGMDPRNERMIHEQIVKSASMAGTSQYFLITPKLLPDLYYNEHMCVLCIYNGEWQPEKLKSPDHYLQQAKKTMAAT